MGSLVVRFSAQSLAHVGKTAWAALELALQLAPASARWRGVAGKRFAAPRAISAAGLAPVRTALEKQRQLPRDAVMLLVKDGPTETLAPESFAVWLSLAKDWKHTFATQSGLLSVALPLERLDALVALGDELVERLRAEVAWCGPSVWLAPHCLFNSASNELPDFAPWLIELFGVDPQLDAPHLYASRWPFTADEVEPDVFSGVLAPSWTTWLAPKLAKKVTAFPPERTVKRPHFTRYQLSDAPPFAMTEAVYAQWRAGWAALAPVHLRNDDPSPTAKYFRGRLSAVSHASLLADWREAIERETRAKAKEQELLRELQQLADARSPALLELAERVRDSVDPGSLCWAILPALVELIPAGQVSAAAGLVWLDYGEETGAWRSIGNAQQLTLDAAAVASACGDAARALVLIREAFTVDGALHLAPVFKGRLKRDARFKALRKLPEWKALVD